jgi:hypothetical protein
MRQTQELVDEADLVQQLERRRMDRVPPEVPEEVHMFLEHNDVDPLTSQEKTGHHARRSAADDYCARILRAHVRHLLIRVMPQRCRGG